jgi:hypothetical protein
MPETDRHADQLYRLRAVLHGISPLIWTRWYWMALDPSRLIGCGVIAANDFELPYNR